MGLFYFLLVVRCVFWRPDNNVKALKATKFYTHSKNDSYFRLDLGDGDGEVDRCSEAWNRKTTCWNAPADTVSVPRIILKVACANHVDAVQPVVFTLPRLL